MNIKVKRVTPPDLWRECAEYTTGKDCKMSWSKMLALGHSPIRASEWAIKLMDVPLFVVSHLVRHHVGVQVYQKSHRPDRDKNAKDEGRMTPTNAMILINAEAIINISKKRLCAKASAETREIWGKVVEEVRKCDPDLANHCVKPCVYCGFCREAKSCGFTKTDAYSRQREDYLRLFE